MRGYYSRGLSGERLRRCYEIASPRVRRYFEAEIQFVIQHLTPDHSVLELGCGYGRVTSRLAGSARRVVGIDTSAESLSLARRLFGRTPRCEFREMDALDLSFAPSEFDTVVCVQNGICAFGVDRKELMGEALRVTRPGGCVLFSTYSEKFWPDRLEWFEAQAEAGLIGAIDRDRTGNGTIVCEDGFRSGRLTPAAWRSLAAELGVIAEITEIDESSVWCRVVLDRR